MDANGASFERGRMEANVQSICFLEPAGVPPELKNPYQGFKAKGSDVATLVRVYD